MSSSRLSLPRSTAPVARLDRLQPAGAAHPEVRRYSRARRNLLPRSDRIVAVAGTWAHDHLVRHDVAVETVLWCPGQPSRPALEAAARAMSDRAGRAYRISERTLARIHPGQTAPALLSLVALPRWRAAQVIGSGARLVLVADGIEYAGNLGTLVRTADACGADGLVLTRATARVTHPKAFVASRGTMLTTPVLEYDEVGTARADLAAAGFTTYVADPDGATSYRDAGLGHGPTAVVVGSEGDGVAAEWRTGLTRISIPMHGLADSLNVAASAAVLLFEARARADEAGTRGVPGGRT